MKILAIVIPHSDRHTGNCSLLNFPLGLAYVLASVRKHFRKVDINVTDFAVKGVFSDEGILRELNGIKKKFEPDFVIFGGMITRFNYIRQLSRSVKIVFPHSKLILGGSAAGSGYKFFLQDGIVDYLVVGEGEEAVIDILNEGGLSKQNIMEKGKSGTPEAKVIEDIDSIPFPSYSDFDLQRYIDSNLKSTGWRFMPLIASRGCPFSCNFCYPNFGNKVRSRSEDLVIDEMEYLKRNHNIDSVYFWDEIQFLNKAWVEKFCRKLISRNLGLKWVCVSRASLFSDNDIPLLKLANKAGCLRIAVGIESGNQGILDKMNKRITTGQIESSIRTIRRAGIKASGTMLAGYPGENEHTIQDSVNFANRNLLKTSFYCLVPLPGSGIYDSCVQKNIINCENEYLEKVSSAGGDASRIVINLTDMDDMTYKAQVEKANRLVSKVGLRNYLNYHGIFKGFFKYFQAGFKALHIKLLGRMFETP